MGLGCVKTVWTVAEPVETHLNNAEQAQSCGLLRRADEAAVLKMTIDRMRNMHYYHYSYDSNCCHYSYATN